MSEELTAALEEHRKEMKRFKLLLLAELTGIGVVWLSLILLAWAILG